MINNYGTQDAIKFLTGTGTDSKGRTIQDYLQFSPERWEECHDHIQWAFPTDIPSAFNPNAPIINQERMIELVYFSGDYSKPNSIHSNIKALLTAYLNSVGFNWDENDYKVVNFPVDISKNNIFTPNNHNFRRLTRIIRCLSMFRLTDDLINLKQYLFDEGMKAAAKHSCPIHPLTIWHWYHADDLEGYQP